MDPPSQPPQTMHRAQKQAMQRIKLPRVPSERPELRQREPDSVRDREFNQRCSGISQRCPRAARRCLVSVRDFRNLQRYSEFNQMLRV